VAISSRASTRIPRDGIPIAEKAMRRAQDKDNFTSEMAAIIEAS